MIVFENGVFYVTIFYRGKQFCETFDKLYEAVALVKQFKILEEGGLNIVL